MFDSTFYLFFVVAAAYIISGIQILATVPNIFTLIGM